MAALVADRRGDLHVHARAPTQRSAEVPGPHLTVIGKPKQRVAQRVKYPLRSLLLVDGQVGAGDVADEQRVAAEHRPRLRTAGRVGERERGVLRAVTRRVQGPHSH